MNNNDINNTNNNNNNAYITSSPRAVQTVINNLSLSPRKKWGQNFLIDANIVRRIIDELEPEKDDCVLEIGPGLGALTLPLAGTCRRLLALEIDPAMVDYLTGITADIPGVTIIPADVRKISLSEICLRNKTPDIYHKTEHSSGEHPIHPYQHDNPHLSCKIRSPVKIAGNLPYYITSSFLFDLFRDYRLPWKKAVFMVQKEVAERITAPVNSAGYGSLSVLCRAFTRARIAFTVSEKVFYPRPQVDSAVVTLQPSTGFWADDPGKKEAYINLVSALFQHRRKTLVNSLSYYLQDKNDARKVLSRAGTDGCRRPASLEPLEFAKISCIIYNKSIY